MASAHPGRDDGLTVIEKFPHKPSTAINLTFQTAASIVSRPGSLAALISISAHSPGVIPASPDVLFSHSKPSYQGHNDLLQLPRWESRDGPSLSVARPEWEHCRPKRTIIESAAAIL